MCFLLEEKHNRGKKLCLLFMPADSSNFHLKAAQLEATIIT
jgi:hypothetical protein